MADENDVTWKEKLYALKESAPQPIAVVRQNRLSNTPSFFGDEFHGELHHPEAEGILRDVGQGAYLIRHSTTECYILSFIFDGTIYNYETFYYDGAYWIGQTQFDNIANMVKNGLETMYIEKYAPQFTKMMSNKFKMDSMQRSHTFKVFPLKAPKNCGVCETTIWCPFQKRFKCIDCGYSVHERCLNEVIVECKPRSKYVKRIFGVDLVTYCMAHSVEVPGIILKCIKEIEDRALEEEGIYRVCGSSDQIDTLRKQFDAGVDVDLSLIYDINTVCSLLKLYIKSIPKKLIPYEIFENIFAEFGSLKTDNEKLQLCRQEFSKLDPYRAKTLKCLLKHFQAVIQFSDQNLMKPRNLAMIFCPTLFGLVLPQPDYINVLTFMITTPNIL